MIQVQWFTRACPGEIIKMRATDIDMSVDVWRYRPTKHKNTWRGKGRIIYLGPRAQDAVRPFLTTTGYLL